MQPAGSAAAPVGAMLAGLLLAAGATSTRVAPGPDERVPDDLWPPAPACEKTAPKQGAPQPHIILHVTDDQGWANVGYHNKGHVITPAMDRLATEEGIRFERHYAFQWCAPSRASLLTGRLPCHVLESTAPGRFFPAGVAPDKSSQDSHPTSRGKVTPTAVTRGMTMLPKKLQSVGCESQQRVCCPAWPAAPEHSSMLPQIQPTR